MDNSSHPGGFMSPYGVTVVILAFAVALHQQCTALSFLSYYFRNRFKRTAWVFLIVSEFPWCSCVLCVWGRILTCRGLWLIALLADDSFSVSTCWRCFNHAGNLPSHASSQEVTFPTHHSYFPLNWDPLCCDSIFTRWKMAGQDFKPPTPPPSCEVDKFV